MHTPYKPGLRDRSLGERKKKGRGSQEGTGTGEGGAGERGEKREGE